MNIKWMVWMSGVLLALIAVPAMAWQCRHGFAELGDAAHAVRQKCGTPDFIYPGGKRGSARARDEFWYYNPGPGGFLRVLQFRSGKLTKIDTGGYGFGRVTQRCTPADLRRGMSVYELTARCGKPKNQRVFAGGTTGGKHSLKLRKPRTEIWTYDFGTQYLIQKVTLVDAQIDSVVAASRDQRR